MRWFENLPIRRKLFYGFSISIVFVIFLSVYSIRQLSNINKDYKDTINAANINVEVIADVSNSFMRIRLESRNMIININDLDSVKKSSDTINTLYRDIDSKMNDYLTKINDTKTATLENITAQDVTALSDALSKIVTALLNIENYAKANQTNEALQLLQSLTPTAEAISVVLDNAYKQSLSASDQMVEKNSNASNTAILVMSVLSIIVEALVVIISLIVSGVVARSLKNLRADAKKVAEGHLSVNLATNKRDEVGQLSNDFASVLDTFRLFSSEIKNMYDRIDGMGDIEARIDESKFENDYKTLAQEINKTFDNIITDISVVVKAADSYANGDFSVECKRFIGKKAMMHETLDILRNNLSLVYNEINIVAASAGEGKLAARIESKKFSGDWRKLIEALNALLESVLSPVSETIEVLDKMSEGNLQVAISGNYTGEFGRMKDSINSTIGMINNYINEITNILSDMAKEDLTSEITNEYYGDFAPIKESLNLILRTFNTVLSEINLSAEQVSSGARQISESSMTLAQGASEQANSVDQLTVTLESINVQTSQNAQKAEDANKLATSAKENADLGNEEMNKMLDAMREISGSSQNISKIIKVIEEIALQTNLLALNAAVEAAHAGKHGKGFTVVADQVRNLAGRSAEAAKQTTALIEGTVEKVSHGMKIADDTAAMLEKIVGQISDISELVGGVATSSNLQAEAISQVNMGIGQISQVTQINSATSQEEAASSQQLSSQAEVFKNMVSRFKLKSKLKSGSTSKQTKMHDYDSPKRSGTVSAVSVKPTVSEYHQPQRPAVSVKAATSKPEFVKTAKPEITQAVKPAVVKPATTKPASVNPVASKPATVKSATAKPSVPVQRSGAVDANKLAEKKVQVTSTFNSDYDNKDFGKY